MMKGEEEEGKEEEGLHKIRLERKKMTFEEDERGKRKI